MNEPSLDAIYDAIDATWPARRLVGLPDWTVRDGGGGGNRVSAATAKIADAEIETMAMSQIRLGQEPLVMVRAGEEALDRRLAQAGYVIRDPVTIYTAPVTTIATDPPRVTAFHVAWPPTAVQREIWEAGGIGPARTAVMNRVRGPKCSVLGRADDRPAGTAFVAQHGPLAMIHALEVAPDLRRRGTAVNMMRGAAIWARDRGADWLAILVTDANGPANALYAGLGMVPQARYHYRVGTMEDRPT